MKCKASASTCSSIRQFINPFLWCVQIFAVAMAASVLLCGCGKNKSSSGNPSRPSQNASDELFLKAAQPSGPTVQVSTPVLQPILTAWQEGNSTNAVKLFTQANWSGRPIFPLEMALGLTDAQLKGLTAEQQQLNQSEMERQLNLIKDLATAVDNAGLDASSKGNATLARQCFTSLKQFGMAINDPAAQQLVRLTGNVCVNMGNRGLASLHQ